MGNKQHSWSGQLAKDASSTSRSGYKWKSPKTFGCRSLNYWSLKTQQDPRWLDSHQTERALRNQPDPTPKSTWTGHCIGSRHFSVLAPPVEGETGKDGLELKGSEHEGNSNLGRMNSDLPRSWSESEYRTKNYFCQANNKYLFELSCQQHTHSKEYLHLSAVPFPHLPAFLQFKMRNQWTDAGTDTWTLSEKQL